MGLELAKAYVRVRGEHSQLKSDLDRAKPTVSGFSKAMGRIISTSIGIYIGMAARAAVRGMINYTKELVELSSKQIQSEQRVAAVVKATGMAAGFTADQLKEQAAALQEVTTVGDEAILEAQAVLLTFRKVSGDVFKETVEAALDMSAVLGQSATSGALQLGKALEDPIRGVTALRRTGVSFTAQQQEQIRALVETGKLHEAQVLILDEVKGQLGGVAKSMADTPVGRLEQTKNVLGDIKEKIGNGLIPVMQWFYDRQVKTWNYVLHVTPYVRAAFDVIAGMIDSLADHWGEVFHDVVDWIGGLSDPLIAPFKSFFSNMGIILDTMLGSWEGFGEGIHQVMIQTTLALKMLWIKFKDWFVHGLWSEIQLKSTKASLAMFEYLGKDENDPVQNELRAKVADLERQMKNRTKESSSLTNEELAEIKRTQEEELIRFRMATNKLPKLSDKFNEALARILNEKVSPEAPPIATALGLGNGEMQIGGGIQTGQVRFAFADLGRNLQDALLQQKNTAAERTADAIEDVPPLLNGISSQMDTLISATRDNSGGFLV